MIEFIDLKTQQARLKEKIEAGIQRVLAHGQYILGPEVKELEEKLAAYVGAKYCITCANGTDALQIVQMAFGIGPGDEVITPGFTYIATAETVAVLGATPCMWMLTLKHIIWMLKNLNLQLRHAPKPLFL